MRLPSFIRQTIAPPKVSDTDREKKMLQEELTQSMMKLDRRSNTVRQLADDVMRHMREGAHR